MEDRGAEDLGFVRGPMARPLLSLVFGAFVTVSFIGLRPFAARLPASALVDFSAADRFRPFAVVGLAATMLAVFVLADNRSLGKLPRLVPWPILLVLAWCGLTLFWSPVPFIGLKRLALTAVAILAVFTAVYGLGPMPAIRLFASCLAVFVAVSLLAGPFVANAKHLVGEQDAALVGAWRGVFYHKNHAGAVSALCVVLNYFLWRNDRRKLRLLAVAGGLALLVLSRSKSSMILCLPALAVGLYFGRLRASSRRVRVLLTVLAGTTAATAITIAYITLSDHAATVLSDPESFTGRVLIWRALLMVSAENPWGGVGFGSLYQTGGTSHLIHVVGGSFATRDATAWLAVNAHGHNGYLDLLASIGVIGFSMAVSVFLVMPWRQILCVSGIRPDVVGLSVACIALIGAHNLAESSFLDKDNRIWVSLVAVLAFVHASASKRGSGGQK